MTSNGALRLIGLTLIDGSDAKEGSSFFWH